MLRCLLCNLKISRSISKSIFICKLYWSSTSLNEMSSFAFLVRKTRFIVSNTYQIVSPFALYAQTLMHICFKAPYMCQTRKMLKCRINADTVQGLKVLPLKREGAFTKTTKRRGIFRERERESDQYMFIYTYNHERDGGSLQGQSLLGRPPH